MAESNVELFKMSLYNTGKGIVVFKIYAQLLVTTKKALLI